MEYYKKLYNKLHYYFALCVLTVSPVLAEGDTNNNANPVAAATGNVSNTAVQFQNNGASSRQSYGPNIQCNGSTMTFSPFYMGSHVNPYTADEDTRDLYPSSYQLNENWGFQVNFMVPLDREGLKQCKAIAKTSRRKDAIRLRACPYRQLYKIYATWLYLTTWLKGLSPLFRCSTYSIIIKKRKRC